MNSFNQSNMNDSRNTSRRSSLFSNLNQDDSMASRQSRENSLMSINRYKSPFYEGKVSFGGSSAKRVRLSQVLPYNLSNKPASITRIKESDIKRSNEFDQLSNATKNMLENIYKISSPLEDAKRIPVFNSSNQSSEKFMIDIHDKPFKRLSSLRTPKLVTNRLNKWSEDREKLQLKWSEDDFVQAPQYELPSAPLPLPINSNSLPTFNFNNMNKRTTNTTSTTNQYIKSSNVNSLKRPLISITQEDDSSDAFEEFKFSAPKLIKLETISDSFYKDSIKKNVTEQTTIPKSINLTPIKDPPSSTTTSSSTTSTSTTINLTASAPQSQKSNPPSSTDLINLETNKTVEMYKLDKLDSDFNPKENKATLANTNQLPIKSTVGIKLANEKFNFDGLPDFVKNNSMASKKWTCSMCDVRNELTDSKCVSCEQPRLKEAKDKSNFTFGNINTEKRGFNAFKFDAKPPVSIVSSNNNNSTLSNTQSAIDTTANTKTETSTTPSLSEPLSSNSSTIEIESTSLVNANQLPIKSTDGVKLVKEKFNFDGLPDFVKNNSMASKKWTCTMCDVRNELTDSKCVSCEQPRLKEAKDKSNFTFGNINTEKQGFSAFKFDAKPPTSIESSSSNSTLSSTQSVINTTATTKIELLPISSTIPSLSGSLSTNNSTISSNKIDSALFSKTITNPDKSTTDKPINKSSNNESTDTTKPSFSFGSLSSEKQGFNFFKFDTKLPNSIVSSNNNSSILSNTQSINNTTANTKIEPISMPSLSNSLSSNSSTIKIESALFPKTTTNTDKSTTDKPIDKSSNIELTKSIEPQTNEVVTTGKPLFGLSSTNIFSPSTNLTNGFGSSVPDNLFSNPAPQTNNNQSSTINSTFSNAFSQVPASFNFGTNGFGSSVPDNLFSNPAPQTNNNQSSTINSTFSNAFSQVPISFNFAANSNPAQSNSVFQFNAPKSDAPIAQPMMNNQHGRYIKKAKRRLGQKDN